MPPRESDVPSHRRESDDGDYADDYTSYDDIDAEDESPTEEFGEPIRSVAEAPLRPAFR
jgi:hypothetical protein